MVTGYAKIPVMQEIEQRAKHTPLAHGREMMPSNAPAITGMNKSNKNTSIYDKNTKSLLIQYIEGIVH